MNLKQELLEYGWNPYLEFDDEKIDVVLNVVFKHIYENTIRKLRINFQFNLLRRRFMKMNIKNT